MSARRKAVIVSVAVLALGGPWGRGAEKTGPAPEAGLEGLFDPPVAVRDQDGMIIRTQRAVGHPVAFDWNADGRSDILLGCHLNMDTAAGGVLVLLNVGTPAKPRFQWPAKASMRLTDADTAHRISCGCKSGGTPEVHVTDWNGDGRFDLVVNTYWTDGVRVFLNSADSKTDPTFRRGEKLHGITSHGKGSGGGDWTGDGVIDFVFPVNAYGWAVYPGIRGPDGSVKFARKTAFSSSEFNLVGQKRWFDRTPYAWNFSGRNGPGSAITEIVAVVDDEASTTQPYVEKLCHINYYWLDRAAKTCTRKGTLATNTAALTRLGLGDLNDDGCMDVLYTGGVFTRGDETEIHVLYGKAQNIPKRRPRKPSSGPAE